MVPEAFRIAAEKPGEPEREVRLACREVFRKNKLLKRLIPTIGEILAAGELEPPSPHKEAVPIAIPNPENIGDVGHRS